MPSPQACDAIRRLAHALLRDRRDAPALLLLAGLDRVSPGEAGTQVLLALAWLRQGNPREAQRLAGQARALGVRPELVAWLEHRASLQLDAGRTGTRGAGAAPAPGDALDGLAKKPT